MIYNRKWWRIGHRIKKYLKITRLELNDTNPTQKPRILKHNSSWKILNYAKIIITKIIHRYPSDIHNLIYVTAVTVVTAIEGKINRSTIQ